MSRRGRLALVLSWLGVVASTNALAAPPVNDATRASARKLAEDGVQAYQDGNYAVATEKLERAFQVLRVPSLGLWSARALEKSGKLVEASERLLETTRLEVQVGEVSVQQQARADAETERQALLPRLPSLTLKVEGADGASVECTLDGESVPSGLLGEARPVNPGQHAVECRRGEERVNATATVEERQSMPVKLTFAAHSAAPSPAPSPASAGIAETAAAPEADSGARSSPGWTQRTLGWATLGVGAAGLAVGGVTGIMLATQKSDLAGSCNDQDECDPNRQGDVDSYNALRPVSTIALIAGAALATTGVVLIATAPKRKETGHLKVHLGFMSIGAEAAF